MAWLLRGLQKRRRGQALPLAALGLLIMVLAIVATMNLSQAVYQKIRLQNSADAAAYSLAAMEARAFNFIALTNRTQIVHYNTGLALQSYLSYAGFIYAMAGSMRDIINAVAKVNEYGCKTIPTPYNSPWCAGEAIAKAAAAALIATVTIARMVYEFVHRWYQFWKPVEAMSLFNRYAIWQMQFLRLFLINSHLITGMYEFIRANDDQMGLTAHNNWFNMALNSLLNSLEFRSVFDSGAGLNPFWVDLFFTGGGLRNLANYKKDPSDDRIKDAMAVMAELTNASRNHRDIYNRSGPASVIGGIGTISGQKFGQAKIVDQGDVGPEVPDIREGTRNYPVGDTLASDDFMTTAGAGFALAGPSFALMTPFGMEKLGDGLYADEEGGEHYQYKASLGMDPAAPGGQTGLLTYIFPVRVKDRFTTKSGKHKWKPSPYFKFNPVGETERDYGQPSTWIFLNKHHKNFQTGGNKKPWHYEFNFRYGSLPQASLDTTIGGERAHFLLEGLNVVSRGMVYYHRPGCWDEHPNFFNPFWRARLAPIGSALQNIFNKYVSSHITTGSDNAAIRYIINFLRNAIADVFFRTVTSVMTH
jgi:hypothetical protein